MDSLQALFPTLRIKIPSNPTPVRNKYEIPAEYFIGMNEGLNGNWSPTSMDFIHISGWMSGIHNGGHTTNKPAVNKFTPPFGVWF